MDPWSSFLYGMKAPMTKENYRGRLAKFFDFIGLTKGTMEGCAQAGGSMLALAGTNKLARYCLVCAAVSTTEALFKLDEAVNNLEVL